MFNKDVFSEILTKIYKTYNNQRDFADATEVNRAYLSQYMNKKLDNPPTPKILGKIANASRGIISYAQLMEVCGYIDVSIDISANLIKQKTEYIINNNEYLLSIGLTNEQIVELQNIVCMDISSKEYQIALDDLLAILSLEQSYAILKLLQNMVCELRNDAEEKLNLSQTLEIEAKEFIDNASSIEELNFIEQKYNKQIQYYMCPVYGQISAGQPNWAEECIEGRLPIDPDLMGIVNPEEHFFLRVNGESMNKVIRNGAFALIHKQDMVEDGEIAVVLVNGDAATLKRFTRKGDIVVLEPDSDDPEIKTQIYDKTTPIKILGKYVGKMEINK